MRLLSHLRFYKLYIVAVLVLVVCMIALVNRSDKTMAASSTECRVLLSLDNSISVGSGNWNAYRSQIKSLFSNAYLKEKVPDLKLAFWTFSNKDDGGDFNPYYQDFVTAFGPDSGFGTFNAKLEAAPLDGAYTNYAQGFGYNPARNGTTNTFALSLNELNRNGDIRRIAHSPIYGDPDVIAILTDGAPNHPGFINPARPQDGEFYNDGNPAATESSYQARSQYPNTNVIAGFINSADRDTALTFLGRAVNNDYTPAAKDAPNLGSLDFDDSLSSFLVNKIPEACNVQTIDYNLVPIVRPNASFISNGVTPTFDYEVRNDDNDNTGQSSWHIFDVTINPGVTGNPLSCGSNSYCDNISGCSAIVTNLLAGRGTCIPAQDNNGVGNDSDSTNDSFPPDLKQLYTNRTAKVDNIDDLPLGTQVCRVLQLSKPTGKGSPLNRTFGACTVMGKAPLVQVHGGDLRVGGHMSGDPTAPDANAGVYVSKFKLSKNADIVRNGRTYGSWTEYGVLAPGPIRSMASLSGYNGANGGYDQTIDQSTCDLNINKLTFANKINDPDHPEQNSQCGYLAGRMNDIPNVVPSLTSRTAIDPTLYSTAPLIISDSSPTFSDKSALYKSDTGNITIGGSTIPKGKTFVVYAPKGTVTIDGNINYTDIATEKYTNIKDIPQLVIIAKDIKINEGVSRVDAWLVATGDGTEGGVIDTCANFARPLRSTVCKELLTINGPVMARQIDLWRTKVKEEACVIDSIEKCNDVGNPAEIINLPGSSILWSQIYGVNASRAQTGNTTELPPYF